MDNGFGYQALLNQQEINATSMYFTGLTTDSLLYATSDSNLASVTLSSGLTFNAGTLALSAAYIRGLFSEANANLTYDSSTGVLGLTSTPTFSGLTVGALSGVLKAAAGVLSGSATTSDLTEGSNLYYTDARARASNSAGTGISYNSSTGVITNSGVTSVTGTANQVTASASTGAVVLSTPQDIATSSTVQFGKIGIGTGSPLTDLHIKNQIAGGSATTLENAFGSSGSYPRWLFKKSRGTTATPTALINGDGQGSIDFYGYDGTNWIPGASILATVDSLTGTNDMPTALTFRTTADGAAATSERLRIANDGSVGVGESSPNLRLVSRNTTSTAQISARYNGTAPTDYKELQLGYDGTSGNGYGWLQAIANGVAYTPLLLQLAGGNVGVGGVTSPDRRLVVQGVGATRDPLLYLKQTNDYGYSFNLDSSSSGKLSIVGVNAGAETVPMITLDRTNTNITFNTGSAGMTFATTDASTGMWIRNDGSNTVFSTKNGSMYYGYGGASGIGHLFYSGVGTPSETMRIADGKVGVGVAPSFPFHVKSTSSPQLVIDDNSGGTAELRHYNSGAIASTYFTNSTGAHLRTVPNLPLWLGYNNGDQARIGDSTGGYPTTLSLINGGLGATLKIQDSAGSGRGHMQFGSSATAANNVHIGCEGNGSFYVWNGTFGGGSQKFQVGSTGNFRFDNNTGYSDDAIYGVGGSYLTLFNTNSGGYSSQIGHDGTTMYINTGAGGNMYLQTFAAGYTALAGRMMLDQAGRLAFNSMTANATLSLLGTAAAPLAGICLGGYGYDATPYHRLELANGAGSYIYYMSQNIVWSVANNRWEFCSAGGWGGYGSMLDFYGNGNVQFRTATNVAGLPSLKTNLDMTNDGKCAMAYGLTVSGYNTIPYSCVGEVYNSGSATQALVTTGAKLSIFDSIGINKNATPSAASDNITITVAGTYQVTFRGGVLFSVLSGGIGILALAIQRNGTSVASSVQYISNHETNSTVMAVTQCLVDCAVNDVLTIFGGSTPNQTITFSNPYLSVTRVGTA